MDGLRARRLGEVIFRLPATFHDGISEQIDWPSTLVTDWLNLYTPIGREYVGHRRVDHEKKSTSANHCPRSISPRRVPIAGSGVARGLFGALLCVNIAVGSGPNVVAVMPDGKTAFVANQVAGTVSDIDVKTRTRTSPTFRWPACLTLRRRVVAAM
jgi:hypothetical protein